METAMETPPPAAETRKEPTPAAAAQTVPETKKEPTPPAPAPAPAPAPPPPAPAAVVVAAAARGDGKRKRGRPRKYGPDGGLLRPLNATPISASVPDDSGGGHYTPASAVGAAMKRGRGRPVGFISRAAPVVAVPVTAATPTPAVVVSTPPPPAPVSVAAVAAPTPQHLAPPLGDVVGCASGANFTPHILNVATGEDINMKVISFSQQGPRAICILSANGVISNVTLRQHDSLGGTVTYEGRFELLSLSGSFTPTEKGGTRDRCGGMSVSLAAADGRVIGGGVAGLLVAASPVQVVVGSFLPSYQMEQNGKKPVIEMKTVAAQPTVGFTISSGGDMADSYSGSQARAGKGASAFRVENWTAQPVASAPPAAEARRTPSSEVIKVPVSGG
ncbi:AT-hook motif nuclear-localized protein 7 [Hordeum vulgare]|uniref:AT-hook motif nuclear-localized protein n=1 Tax=Hordeum vulgare subsp. vulgare TaxID=112509 RepID=A0A8I6YA86_HORVV|nr:AT-hook motif nuclear-localized protein 1-like [Hordeum vulgare subsp. vulgare]KAE8766350.1 AT-hook motif nuclear-localized protein 7 [Hordeum vulgare]